MIFYLLKEMLSVLFSVNVKIEKEKNKKNHQQPRQWNKVEEEYQVE